MPSKPTKAPPPIYRTKYNYDKFLDGGAYELEPGVDYPADRTIHQAEAAIRAYCSKHAIPTEISIRGGVIRVQAVSPKGLKTIGPNYIKDRARIMAAVETFIGKHYPRDRQARLRTLHELFKHP